MANKIFYLLFFAVILALTRIIPHPPNFTPILASAIMAPLLIKDRLFGIAIPIFAMFISDIIIGFHPYQFVVYSTILLIALVSPMRKNYLGLGIKLDTNLVVSDDSIKGRFFYSQTTIISAMMITGTCTKF